MSTNTALDNIKNRVEGHTEGPWQIEEGDEAWEVRAPEGSITWDDHGGEVFRNRADAELIAAAPKLLAALEAVHALAEEWRYKGEFGWGAWQEGHGPDPDGQVLDSASNEIRKAIEGALR